MSDPAPLIIQQINIGQADRITVELAGASLPDRRPSAGVQQRETTEELPGAAEPIVQILGPQWDDMVFSGTFNDADIGTAGEAAALRALMTRLCFDGVPCSLTWGSTWARRGLVKRFEENHDMEDLIGWSLTFRPWSVEDPPVALQNTIGEIDFEPAEIGTGATDANVNAGALRDAQGFAGPALLGRLG